MPTRQPRVNVVVTDAQHRLLGELGALQGRSAASFLREMLDASTPMLEAMLPIYRAAAAQQAMQPEALQTAIRDALAGVEANRAQLDLLEHLAGVQADLANDQGAPVAGAARSGATEDADEPAPAPRKRARG